jgi:hypothetical protein
MSAELRLYTTLKPLLIVLFLEQGYISHLLGGINLRKSARHRNVVLRPPQT